MFIVITGVTVGSFLTSLKTGKKRKMQKHKKQSKVSVSIIRFCCTVLCMTWRELRPWVCLKTVIYRTCWNPSWNNVSRINQAVYWNIYNVPETTWWWQILQWNLL